MRGATPQNVSRLTSLGLSLDEIRTAVLESRIDIPDLELAIHRLDSRGAPPRDAVQWMVAFGPAEAEGWLRAGVSNLEAAHQLAAGGWTPREAALVVALALRSVGVPGDEAIGAIRAARSRLALSNPYFADLARAWPHDPMADDPA